MQHDRFVDTEAMQVAPGEKIHLHDYSTRYTGRLLDKKEAQELLEESRKRLIKIQDKFYADNRYAVLIILQAMDAAGKDGAVKHIMSGFNPLGVSVHSFKAPSSLELDHDYLWRHAIALPARGEIAIHNRSHYENVLVTRVHPEYLLKENIPGIDSVKKVDDKFWEERFKQINRFEKKHRRERHDHPEVLFACFKGRAAQEISGSHRRSFQELEIFCGRFKRTCLLGWLSPRIPGSYSCNIDKTRTLVCGTR